MKAKRAILVSILAVATVGVGYAAYWLSQITAASADPEMPPERVQFMLVAGFGMLMIAAILGSVAVMLLLRLNRRGD